MVSIYIKNMNLIHIRKLLSIDIYLGMGGIDVACEKRQICRFQFAMKDGYG